MSSALAIAGVTSMLTDLLGGWLAEQSVPRSLGSVKVSALAPDLIETGAGKPSQLNLFLYQVTPNPGWRNAGPPARDAGGRRLANPPLALDLHYLLTAYGSQNFHAEMILGYAMQLLHETPILPRDEIRRLLAGQAGRGDDDLQPSELAEQVEQLKISLAPLSVEELSKLWSALQSRYRPSAVYQVSLVLIESARPARAPLPVLTRGAGDRGPALQEGLIPPFAALTAALPPNRQPAIRLGEALALQGFHLDGDQVTVRFASRRLPEPLALAPLPGATATDLQVRLPAASDAWAAGVYAVTVEVRPAGGPAQVSNAIPVALAPRITGREPSPGSGAVAGLDVQVAREPDGAVALRVGCAPPVWPGQAASLLLGERELLAEPFVGKTATLVFRAHDLPPGEYLARLRVDGVESILVDRGATPPRFDPTQRVVVP